MLGGGVAVYDNGTGGLSDLPGRVTHEREEGTTLCVQMLLCFFTAIVYFWFLGEEVKLCDEKVDCKSVRVFWLVNQRFLKEQSEHV